MFNLSFLSKVSERVVLLQLTDHVMNNNLQNQYAYRQNHSTKTTLLHIINCLLESTDQGRVSILSLLVLARWDTVVWSRLKNWNLCAPTDLHLKRKKHRRGSSHQKSPKSSYARKKPPLDLSADFNLNTLDKSILLKRLYTTFGTYGSVLQWLYSHTSSTDLGSSLLTASHPP